MQQRVLAIGLPADGSENQSSAGRSLKVPLDDVLPGFAAETTLPSEVSCLTVPTPRAPQKLFSDVTLPAELREERGELDDDDVDDGDVYSFNTGSFSQGDYLDDKKLAELVADLADIQTKHVAQLKREAKTCKSILRSIKEQGVSAMSLKSLSSDSTELANLIDEQYKAFHLLKEGSKED
jgi:hypothetical protein